MNPLRNNNQRNMLQQFMDFKRSMQVQNPQAVLNQLMNSGKYTQQDLERAKAMAEQFKNLLK